MGVEDFRVALSASIGPAEAQRELIALAEATQVEILDRSGFRLRGDGFVYDVEVWPVLGGFEYTLTVSVCHPSKAIVRFVELVVTAVAALSAFRFVIMEDLPPGVAGDFPPGNNERIGDSVAACIARKRELWKRDFGEEEAPVTSQEAVLRFVMRPS